MAIDDINNSPITQRTRLYGALLQYALDPEVLHAIHTGGGIGDGGTEAIAKAFQNKNPLNSKFYSIELSTRKFEIMKARYANQKNIIPINGNSIETSDYKDKQNIKTFYWTYKTDLRKRDLDDDIYPALKAELAYITARGSGIVNEAIETAKSGLSSDLDFIFIDGSEFCGRREFTKIISMNPKYIALNDINSLKNYENNKTLTEGTDYTKIASGIEGGVHWSIFIINP